MDKDLNTDFEINIAPIVDCLTVLITYLLASATFLSVGIFAVSLPSFGGESSGPQDPVVLTIQLREQNNLMLVSEGRTNSTESIPARSGTWDFESLERKLRGFHEQYPNLKGAVISARDPIAYKDVIKAIELTREMFPQIAVSTEDIR